MPQAHHNLAVALKKNGRYHEAIPHFRVCIKLDPKFPLAYQNLGYALRKVGDKENAIDSYRESLKLCPNDALTWCARAATSL